MSISGLYDSEIGDRLARQSLARFRKIDSSEIDDEEPKRSGRGRKCACGDELARPYITRKGAYVCHRCAAIQPRTQGGHALTNSCEKCKNTVGRVRLVMRHGLLYCKVCAKEF
jgi:hypothetical protein